MPIAPERAKRIDHVIARLPARVPYETVLRTMLAQAGPLTAATIAATCDRAEQFHRVRHHLDQILMGYAAPRRSPR